MKLGRGKINKHQTFRGAIFVCKTLASSTLKFYDWTITYNKESAGMQNEIWHQFGIQNYNGAVLSVYSVL